MTKEVELIERWGAFLLKIENRFNELIHQAKEASAPLVEKLEYDASVISNAWNGISAQVRQLQKKMDDTWEEKMDPQFGMLDSVSGNERLAQMYRYKDLYYKMEMELTLAKTSVLATAGKKIYSNVVEHIDMNKIHQCTQCAAPLNVAVFSFMAKNIKCDACGTVNSYEPDSRIRSLEYHAMDQIAAQKVVDQTVREEEIGYLLWKYDERIPEEKIKVDALREELLQTRQIRLNTYYGFMIENVPDKAEIYKNQLGERLKWAMKV